MNNVPMPPINFPISRMIYTQFQHASPHELNVASNAVHDGPPPNSGVDCPDGSQEIAVIENDKMGATSIAEKEMVSQVSSEVSSTGSTEALSTEAPMAPPGVSVSLLPQYITKEPTTIVIAEASLPKLGSSFLVTTQASADVAAEPTQELFQVKRARPSLHNDQTIWDATTDQAVLTVRRDLLTLPKGFRFEDPADKTILNLPGHFFVPTQGTRAFASFINASTGTEIKLFMRGSYHNRHATIHLEDPSTGDKEGYLLAKIDSEILNARAILGGRRTYEVKIAAGVDVALITGMVIALDARSS